MYEISLTPSLGVTGKCVFLRIWRLIRTRHFLTLLGEFDFTEWYSMSFQITQDSKPIFATCELVEVAVPALPRFHLPGCRTYPSCWECCLLTMVTIVPCFRQLPLEIMENSLLEAKDCQPGTKDLSLCLQVGPNPWNPL